MRVSLCVGLMKSLVRLTPTLRFGSFDLSRVMESVSPSLSLSPVGTGGIIRKSSEEKEPSGFYLSRDNDD